MENCKRSTVFVIALLFNLLVKDLCFSGESDVQNKTFDDEKFNKLLTQLEEAYRISVSSQWNYSTNITDHNFDVLMNATNALHDLKRNIREEVNQVYGYLKPYIYDRSQTTDSEIKKVANLMRLVQESGDAPKAQFYIRKMEKMFSSAKLCGNPADEESQRDATCYSVDSDLRKIMFTSHNLSILTWAWGGFRNETGKKIRSSFTELVKILNEGALKLGLRSNKDFWLMKYNDLEFEEKCKTLWDRVKPLYIELHAFARRRLITLYENDSHIFPSTGHIPAHLSGNMWGHDMKELFNYMKPFPDVNSINITEKMLRKNFTVKSMFQMAENFFLSLGFRPMSQSFWNNSMFVKPSDNRQVVCHGSAWNMYNGDDFRIRMCSEVNAAFLNVIHHEIGHIAYHDQYKHLPIYYRNGANPAFHEALGDLIVLSVDTPKHLNKIGLLTNFTLTREFTINKLMKEALTKVIFLPYALILDTWRWSVFTGATGNDSYNRAWWDLRCKYQGMSPPIPRSELDFDPGSKYHVSVNVPYIRYFISTLLQYQMHKHLCKAAGQELLNDCDIYNSSQAGRILRQVLSLGASRPWPEAMLLATGKQDFDPAPMLEYFQPLYEWLKKENEGHEKGWDDECPLGTFSGQGLRNYNFNLMSLIFMIFMSFLFENVF